MSSLLDPTILFFILGLAAGVLRSNLDIPQAVSRFLSLYLLMALGLKGGFALAKSGFSAEVVASLACAGAASRERCQFAISTARMSAGDSISAIAAAMWPPAGRPRVSRYCTAVMKVTALTEP